MDVSELYSLIEQAACSLYDAGQKATAVRLLRDSGRFSLQEAKDYFALREDTDRFGRVLEAVETRLKKSLVEQFEG